MYRIEDKSAAIKNVQRLLGVNQTGFYDAVTKDLVRGIQRGAGREQTALIDFDTFELIVEEYHRRKMRSYKGNYLFNPRFPYKINDLDENVGAINSALRTVLIDYVYEGILPGGAFLGEATVRAANFLRGIFGMPKSEEIDEEFVNRLLMEKKAVEIKSKYG